MPSPSNLWHCPTCGHYFLGSALDAAACRVCHVGYLHPVSPWTGTFQPVEAPLACDHCGVIHRAGFPNNHPCTLCGEGTVYTIKPELLPWATEEASSNASPSPTNDSSAADSKK